MTLLQAIATAQGMEEEIADSSVVVFRKENGKRAVARFDVSEIRSGDATDPPLKAGDVVVVGKSFTKEAFNNFTQGRSTCPSFHLFLMRAATADP